MSEARRLKDPKGPSTPPPMPSRKNADARSPEAPRSASAKEEGASEASGKDRRAGSSAGLAWLVAVVVATGGITAFYSVRADLGEERIAHAEAREELDTSRAEVAALQAKVAALEAERAQLAEESRKKDEALEELQRAQNELQKRLQQEIAKGAVLISNQHGELVVDLLNKIVFDSGKAELNEKGKRVLEQVGRTLAAVPDKIIQVTGHTDNQPISDKLVDRFPSNWELSTARATNVVRFLQDELGIPGNRLVAAGVAEYRPIARNTTPSGRSRNRRIEVRLLPMPKK